MTRGRIPLFLPASLAAFALGLWLSIDFGIIPEPAEPPIITGFLITPPKAVEDFTPIDQDGQSFHKERWRGQWTFSTSVTLFAQTFAR